MDTTKKTKKTLGLRVSRVWSPGDIYMCVCVSSHRHYSPAISNQQFVSGPGEGYRFDLLDTILNILAWPPLKRAVIVRRYRDLLLGGKSGRIVRSRGNCKLLRKSLCIAKAEERHLELHGSGTL
jgi:hypothetical protein